MASVLRSVHTKLLKASPKIVLDKIVSLEMKELEDQLKEAISEQVGRTFNCRQGTFVTAAMSPMQHWLLLIFQQFPSCKHEESAPLFGISE